MGWAFGINTRGREVGYGVEATCDFDGCEEKIDRGLAYVCGGMHDGGEYGCGDYFCGKHLYGRGLCEKCKDANCCDKCEGRGHNDDGEECCDCDGMGDLELV